LCIVTGKLDEALVYDSYSILCKTQKTDDEWLRSLAGVAVFRCTLPEGAKHPLRILEELSDGEHTNRLTELLLSHLYSSEDPPIESLLALQELMLVGTITPVYFADYFQST